MQIDVIIFLYLHIIVTKGVRGVLIMMNSRGFVKGMAAGVILGACATMIVDPVSDRQRHRMRKKTEGMFRNIGNIIDNAMDLLR